MTPWWDQQTAILIGAIGGSAIGVMGGVYGTLVSMLAPKGIGRRPMLAIHLALVGFGVAVLIAGIVAVSTGQPYLVYYPLLLGGGILSFVMGGLFPVVRMHYRQAEARRLEAEQFRRE